MYCKLTYMGNSDSCTVHMHMVILVGVVSVVVKWLSVNFLHYRYEVDKSTKLCMNLP